MNNIELTNEELNKDIKDAYIHRLSGNIILAWVDALSNVNRYKEILKECPISSTLEVESGIVKINTAGRYISHKFAPHVLAGFSFYELSVIMRYEIIAFEDEYGEVLLSDSDIEGLKQIAYIYNRAKIGKLDMSDRKRLIHLDQTSKVLNRLLTPSIILENRGNGWCSLTFTAAGHIQKDYCTILTKEQLDLLERVNRSIKGNKI